MIAGPTGFPLLALVTIQENTIAGVVKIKHGAY